jgi:hypothetical protein
VGVLLRTEGVVAGYTQTGFESFSGFSDAGEVSYSPTVTQGDSVFLDNTQVAVETEPHPTLAGQFWRFASRPGVTAGGTPYFVGGITDTQGGTTQNRGLFYGIDGGTVLILGGQLLPGLPRPVGTGTAVSFDYRFSGSGANYIANVVMAAPTADDNVMTLNGAGLLAAGALIQEATAIPAGVGGLPGELWVNFDSMGVNNAGNFFFSGDSNAATTADEFIYQNCRMRYRDGQTIDGLVVQGDIEAAYMNDNGDVAYIWDTVGNTIETLYLNGRKLLAEGDAVDLLGNDGVVEPTSIVSGFTGIAALGITDRLPGGAVRVYFVADVDVNGTTSTTDDISGAFVMTVTPCPADTNDDDQVNVTDLLAVIGAWGPCVTNTCVSDVNVDCNVNVTDLLSVIGGWGACP